MIPLPLNVRCWAALCHLSVIVWIFLLNLFFWLLLPFVEGIDAVRGECLVKPFSGCNNEVFLILSLIYLAEFILLWSLPYVSVLVALIILHLKGKTHSFIKNHGQEALTFQFRLANSSLIVHFACTSILLVLSKPYIMRTFAGTLFLILLCDLFFFSVFGILQLLATLNAAIHYSLVLITIFNADLLISQLLLGLALIVLTTLPEQQAPEEAKYLLRRTREELPQSSSCAII